MADNKQRLFEVMEKVVPDFKQPENVQELQQTTVTQLQQSTQYSDKTYKMIAPALKLVNTPDKFAPAFKGWFEYLGYSPQAGNINIQRVRTDVENVMKLLGYK